MHNIGVELPDEGQFTFGSIRHEFRNVMVEEGRETALFARMLPGRSGVTDYAPPAPEEAEPQMNTDE